MPLWVPRLLVGFGGVLFDFGCEYFCDVSAELFVASCGVRGLSPWIANQLFRGFWVGVVGGDN